MNWIFLFNMYESFNIGTLSLLSYSQCSLCGFLFIYRTALADEKLLIMETGSSSACLDLRFVRFVTEILHSVFIS